MPGSISLLGHQIGILWKHFGINQKVSIILALMVTALAIGGTLYWSSQPDFRLLYTGMSLEDAARAQEQLEDAKITVQLRSHGQAIYVPAADVYRARLMLAANGLPKDSSTGFEIFEQPKFGLTEFAQQVNFQRALQGELERTIMAVNGVQSARVMLVMPKDKLFASERDKAASASIMLTLNRGVRLSGEQISSISQLVSAAVPGMGDGHITITDQMGRMLTDDSGSKDPIVGSSQRQMDMRRNVEDSLARKAQDMLDLAIGAGKAMVRVSADIDFRRIERHSETYDAEGRVLFKETISSENSSDPVGTPQDGVARVAVGDPKSTVTMEQATSKKKREDVESEYRIPSGRESILDQGGRIERLSVSVSVAQGETARSAEELKNIERMVRSAVGAVSSAQRQDSIEVIEMAFHSSPDTTPKPALPLWWTQLPFSPTAALRTLAGIVMLAILISFSRRTFRSLSIERENVGVPVSMLAGADGSTHALGAGNLTALDDNQSEFDVVSRLAEQSPSVVATWIDHTVRGKN